MRPQVQATSRLSTLAQLDQIRMSPGERRVARAYLRQAELLADMLMRIDADLRHAFAFAWRGIGALAGRGKVAAVRPEPN